MRYALRRYVRSCPAGGLLLYLASITVTGLSSVSYQVRCGSMVTSTMIEIAGRTPSRATAASDRSRDRSHQKVLEHFPHVQDETSNDDVPIRCSTARYTVIGSFSRIARDRVNGAASLTSDRFANLPR